MSGPTPFHIFTAIHKEKKNQKEKTDCYAQIPTLRSSRRGDISIESRKGTFLRSLDKYLRWLLTMTLSELLYRVRMRKGRGLVWRVKAGRDKSWRGEARQNKAW